MNQQPIDWPAAVGAVAERIRSADWRGNGLGPPQQWPAALRDSIESILAAPLPAVVLWGEAQLQLHNDACAPLLGAGHTALLARPFADVRPDLAAGTAAALATATRGGAAQSGEVVLNSAAVPAHFRLLLQPIGDGDGGVGGVLVCFVDVSAAVGLLRQLPPVPEPQATSDATAKLAHELRGSLMAVMMQLSLLDLQTRNQPELQQLVQRAMRGGRELVAGIARLERR